MVPFAATAAVQGASAVDAPVTALHGLLDALVSVLLTIEPNTYAARTLPGVSGSIGEHVRHTLDHVAALVSADPGRTLSYDHRERGTSVERDPGAALRQILRLKAGLERWRSRDADTPMLVRAQVSSAGDAATGWSTLARELAFVITHTIHHQALIAVLLTLTRQEMPDRFGIAPSTPRTPA